MRFVFDAVNDLSAGKRVEDTWLAKYLPMRYRPPYNEGFARRFVTCLLPVSARLWSNGPYRPACVAEQLAFRALLDFAQATLEERGIEPEFGPAWEHAFEDLGVNALFDEVHAVESRLEFSEWFRPIEKVDELRIGQANGWSCKTVDNALQRARQKLARRYNTLGLSA